ncbi:MAG: pyroglutamyl-peptidase I [Negativicutes bacterium]|nr:pyroglutamyl-peptidase I [Negativicutes bacterium]
MSVLLTGFAPFGGETVNPSWEAVRTLSGQIVADHTIVARQLPVVRYRAVDLIAAGIEDCQPVAVVAVGQAGGRPDISVERVALNVDDFRIPDNEGNQPIDLPIYADAPPAYWSTLPIKAIVRDLRQAGIPASVSNTAGTYVCNHLFFGLMHLLSRTGRDCRAGFVHIPYLPGQAAGHPGAPSMDLPVICRALSLIIATTLSETADCKLSGGTIC